MEVSRQLILVLSSAVLLEHSFRSRPQSNSRKLREIEIFSEPSYWHFLEAPPHTPPQKVRGYVVRLTETPVGYFS